jgi:hypothetical protein
MSDIEKEPTPLSERARAAHDAWCQELKARQEQEYQRLADEMRASFEQTFGVAPNYVAPEHREVIHEAITFRYDRRYGASLWYLFDVCLRCHADLLSSAIHNLRELGTELDCWDPYDAHTCPATAAPPSLDQRLLEVLRKATSWARPGT